MCYQEEVFLRPLSPTVPLRSDAEKTALVNAIEGLAIVHEILQLIPPLFSCGTVGISTDLTIQNELAVLLKIRKTQSFKTY